MKKPYKVLFLILAIAVFTLIFVGCTERPYDLPAGFVNAEKLRIDGLDEDGKIKLSPTGEASTFQLNVTVLPENANQQVTYYFPTQYYQYIQVSESGLITAKAVTPEENFEGIPLTITSATNANATMVVWVVVESVSVKEITFPQSEITLVYNSGQTYQITPIFRPAHATDGKDVTYTSLNPEIAQVSNTGLVTPGRAGHTHITVESRTADGFNKSARLSVQVKYEKGEYRLECTDARAQYNQVLGSPVPINFSILALNPRSDPDFAVYWYVGARFLQGQSGSITYSHVPNVDTTTSYRIRVIIREKDQPDIELQSELITIYNDFKGFVFNIENISASGGSGYQYGDVATFNITESLATVSRYEWYLKRDGEEGAGVMVAETTSRARDLVRRLNIEGDFVLTAYGYSAANPTTPMCSYEFPFGVVKFSVGDNLIVTPEVANGGKPPESYNFNLYDSDEAGEKGASHGHIGSVTVGGRFIYNLDQAGNFILEGSAMLEGLVGQVDGKDYYVETPVIRVYSGADDARENDLLKPGVWDKYLADKDDLVENIAIEGVGSNEGYSVLVRWDPMAGAAAFFAEIQKSDGTVYLMDSEGADSDNFKSDYLIIPNAYATLSDSFSVRIRQKGSVYGAKVTYGEGGDYEIIPESAYEYLKPYNVADNLYFLDMREFADALNYVATARPNANSLVTHQVESTDGTIRHNYYFNGYFAFDRSIAAESYPIDTDLSNIADEDLRLVYRLILGAQKAYMPGGDWVFTASPLENGGFRIGIFTRVTPETTKTTEEIPFVAGSSDNYSATPYGNREVYPIDFRAPMTVYSVEQLYYAAERGYKPNIVSSDAALSVYNIAKTTVNGIIGAEMSDREKVTAIYDWLTTNVVYDKNLASLTADDLYLYTGFTLQGVFGQHRAVCDGIAKAFVLLCAIEGIPAVRVIGKVNGAYHAWNEVLVDGARYIVDATNGSYLNEADNVLYTDHRFLLLGKEDYFAKFAEIEEYGEYPVCDGESLDYFADNGMYAEDIDGLAAIVANVEKVAEVRLSDDFYAAFVETPEVWEDEVRSRLPEAEEEKEFRIIVLTDNRIVVKIL